MIWADDSLRKQSLPSCISHNLACPRHISHGVACNYRNPSRHSYGVVVVVDEPCQSLRLPSAVQTVMFKVAVFIATMSSTLTNFQFPTVFLECQPQLRLRIASMSFPQKGRAVHNSNHLMLQQLRRNDAQNHIDVLTDWNLPDGRCLASRGKESLPPRLTEGNDPSSKTAMISNIADDEN